MRRIVSAKKTMTTLIVLVIFVVGACKEEEEMTFSNEETSSYEAVEKLENSFSTINTITNAAIQYAEAENSGRIAAGDEFGCATVSFSGDQDMGKIEIDFGAGGCTSPDGKTRKGKVVVEYSGKRIFYGSVVYTNLSDFYIDNNKIEGTLKSENLSTDPEKPKFHVTVTNGKLIYPDGNAISWQADRTHVWTYSSDKQSIKLTITGTSFGRTPSGNEFDTEITEPLVLTSPCTSTGNYVPVQGIKKITLDTAEEIIADYGDGECDREITVTIQEKSKNVYL